MATNREKYIDNASNEELAQAITNFVMSVVYSRKRDENKSINEYIAEWLSQEAKEDNTKDKEYLEYLEKGGKPRESDFIPDAQADKTCGKYKFHKKVEACIGAIDKMCIFFRQSK